MAAPGGFGDTHAQVLQSGGFEFIGLCADQFKGSAHRPFFAVDFHSSIESHHAELGSLSGHTISPKAKLHQDDTQIRKNIIDKHFLDITFLLITLIFYNYHSIYVCA
jgi:hypothetical protein